MGGDGGVVATNRRYMRGAGTADHTGDAATSSKSGAADIKQNRRQEAFQTLTTCALTGQKLKESDAIVACRYGRLYLKEAAVQVLLKRKTGEVSQAEEKALGHVHKLSELYAVRGNLSTTDGTIQWTCPITAKTLNGTVPPALLLVPGNPENSNVVSEFALQQLSKEDLEKEYGPMERKIRLAPTLEQLEEAKTALEQERLEKKQKKASKNKGNNDTKEEKKRKRPQEAGVKKEDGAKQAKATVGEVIRSRVDAALQSNQVLSSLFADKKPQGAQGTEKDRKDNLFAR